MKRASHTAHDKISTIVYFPGKWVFRANVTLGATLRDLRCLLPEKNVSFILKGRVLSDSCTFKAYGIHNNDVLIVSYPNQAHIASMKYSSPLHESDSISERINNIVNPHTTTEVVRLRDLQMARLERRPKTFRKMCFTIQNSESKTNFSSEANLKSVIPTIPLEKPSTEPLPMLWGLSQPAVPAELGLVPTTPEVPVKQVPSEQIDFIKP